MKIESKVVTKHKHICLRLAISADGKYYQLGAAYVYKLL